MPITEETILKTNILEKCQHYKYKTQYRNNRTDTVSLQSWKYLYNNILRRIKYLYNNILERIKYLYNNIFGRIKYRIKKKLNTDESKNFNTDI